MTTRRPTRLCFATPQFYPTYGGSHQRYLRYLPGFGARGLEVRVFTGTATDEKVTRGDAASQWEAYPVGAMLPPETVNAARLLLIFPTKGKQQ